MKKTFQRFGKTDFVKIVTEEIAKSRKLEFSRKFDTTLKISGTIEQFTDVYHVKFQNIRFSRRAKKMLDAREYYGGILHISYAPEYESLDEARHKFNQRIQDVKYFSNRNK